MKRFKRMGRLGALAVIILALLIVMHFVKHAIVWSNRRHPVKLPGNTSILVLGDSHARDAFHPKFFPGIVNVSTSSESPCFTYYKLRKILPDNPQIDTVIISLAYHHVRDWGIRADEEMMKRFHLILDDRFYQMAAKLEGESFQYNLRRWIDNYALPVGISNDLYEMILLKKGRIEGYPYLGKPGEKTTSDIGNLSRLDNLVELHFGDETPPSNLTPMAMYYLNEIEKICDANSINLYLINTPLHPAYYKRIPPKVIENVNASVELLEDENTDYIDTTQWVFPDSCFRNYNHLNLYGAKIYDRMIMERLRRNRS